jgi:hypothetical protein
MISIPTFCPAATDRVRCTPRPCTLLFEMWNRDKSVAQEAGSIEKSAVIMLVGVLVTADVVSSQLLVSESVVITTMHMQATSIRVILTTVILSVGGETEWSNCML